MLKLDDTIHDFLTDEEFEADSRLVRNTSKQLNAQFRKGDEALRNLTPPPPTT
jgi:hypothetical protein